MGGLIIISLLQLLHTEWDVIQCFIIPFGASAVLVFAAPAAPFSQPRNVVGGHLISAAVGIAVYSIFKETSWWTLGIANGISIALMVATKTVHPPAGATSLLPVTAAMTNFDYLLSPVLVGCVLVLIVGLLYNNVWAKRRYPAFWL
ncbi:MAG: HPP family protein [Anaerolineae bacterium]|nr:HPP family protein [Anaerolineae bacterium]